MTVFARGLAEHTAHKYRRPGSVSNKFFGVYFREKFLFCNLVKYVFVFKSDVQYCLLYYLKHYSLAGHYKNGHDEVLN